MKQGQRAVRWIGTAVFALSAVFCASAQESTFRGSITYLPVSDDRPESDVTKVPESILVYGGDAGFRYEERLSGTSRVIITNSVQSEQHIMFEMLGQKLALVAPVVTASAPVSALDESSVEALPINGYKAISVQVGRDRVICSPEHSFNHPNLPQVQGLVLEFTHAASGVRFRATEINEGQPERRLFTVPSDYNIVTAEELQSVFGMSDE